MDNFCQFSADSATSNTITTSFTDTTVTTTVTTTTNNTNPNYLRKLNKLSQKITKPIIKNTPPQPRPPQNETFNNNDQPHNNNNNNNNNNNIQQQPPVYNISKSEFRDVVQKLTGSPAHDRTISNPPPIHQPKPPSSRLQRIRPPPLAQIGNRPQTQLTPLLNPPPQFSENGVTVTNSNFNFSGFGRPVAPLSPLPPLPTVHAAAESPISAYLRCMNDSMPNLFSPLAPRWNYFAPPQQEQQEQLQPLQPSQQVEGPSSSLSHLQIPTSPLPFGCFNSPISSYPLFSPNSGQLGFPQLPLSPSVPVQSPRGRDL